MSDIVAQLEVLSKESGCLIDLSAILDLAICPKIDLKTDKTHKVEEKGDVICVTPTAEQPLPPVVHEYKAKMTKRCADNSCPFEVREEVCKKNHVALDLEMLVVLGLLSEEDLEKYLKTRGDLREDERLIVEDEDVLIDPLLSIGVGEDDSILNLELLGEDGLLNLDLLNLNRDDYAARKLRRRGAPNDRLLDADVLTEKDYHNEALIDADVLTEGRFSRRGYTGRHPHGGRYPYHGRYRGDDGRDRLLDADVLTEKDPYGKEALIDVDVLTEGPLSRRGERNDRLLDADVLTEKDYHNEALIDADVLTEGRFSRRGNHGNNDRLLDADVLTEKDYHNEALIDVDVLTEGRFTRRGNHGPNDRLLDADVLTDKNYDEAAIDVDILTEGAFTRRGERNDRLLDADVLTEKDYHNEALIDADVLTEGRFTRARRALSDGLLDLDLLTEKDPYGTESLIDLDILTEGPRGDRYRPGYVPTAHNGAHAPHHHKSHRDHHTNGHLTHYQPMCATGFKKDHKNGAKKCTAHDVNHCLAICHSQSALLTIQARVKAGDVDNTLVCAAVEFDENAGTNNCHYMVGPEHEPCHEEQLEVKEGCYTFVRN